MRTLLAALLAWLMPPSGTHRAQAGAAPPAPRRAPHAPYMLHAPLLIPRSPRPPDVMWADDAPLVRPYLVRHCQEVPA
ncbi:hypothetical protein GCM10010129_14600 [Streptomyces fumigatiscleroticus]|nr:hypothetical protein GCM10010129_14600 [Streptomyces fumigatiscleroticus]